MLWGGDETVGLLRQVPLSPHASERTFGSKFSYCAISIRAYLQADAQTVDRLANGFFNDIFWFIAMVTLAIIPLIFLMKKTEKVSLVPPIPLKTGVEPAR